MAELTLFQIMRCCVLSPYRAPLRSLASPYSVTSYSVVQRYALVFLLQKKSGFLQDKQSLCFKRGAAEVQAN